ncbi:MAG: hypothetical protein JWM95_234 [Gemmatimonadetes bacterium]|nr:hypothetical protein [Gemmatimonadota bacterium]
MPTHISCDETGATGPNLLDASQPYFAYAAVAIAPEAADELVKGLIKRYRPQGRELKGRYLVTSSPGRKLVSALLTECGKDAMVSVWEKRFALATQFFEHVFEPVLAKQNSMFYRIGFHKFVSNLLYVSFAASTPRAIHTMEAFQRIVRARGNEPLTNLFADQNSLLPSAEELHDIEVFVACHRQAIADYIDTRSETDPVYRWSLDSSVSAIWSLLMSWSERLDPEPLIVTCDELKALHEMRERFDLMIGRTDRPVVTYPTGDHSPIFNLAEPLRFAKSHDEAGIQVADVVAAAAAHAFRNMDASHSREWLRLLGGNLQAIIPDVRLINLSTREGAINAVVLKELVDRSVKHVDLFEGMGEFIRTAYLEFPSYHQRISDANL